MHHNSFEAFCNHKKQLVLNLHQLNEHSEGLKHFVIDMEDFNATHEKHGTRAKLIGTTDDFDETTSDCLALDTDTFEIQRFESGEFQSIKSEFGNASCPR